MEVGRSPDDPVSNTKSEQKFLLTYLQFRPSRKVIEIPETTHSSYLNRPSSTKVCRSQERQKEIETEGEVELTTRSLYLT